ncbi:MAG: shikimate kinase [Cyclobacteriaceae bacterium]
MTETLQIFLCGMPGSGKTCLGKELAGYLSYDFIDLDDVIVQKEGKKITEIFSDSGEDYFRTVESEVLRRITENNAEKNVVISLGGGTPCFHNNMHYVNLSGISLFIDPPVEVLVNRMLDINEISKRPLLASGDKDEVFRQLNSRYEQRLRYYKEAKIKIKGDESIEQISFLIKSFRNG